MNDRELLELAAKAAGITLVEWSETFRSYWTASEDYWNPLTDDGDALRLAVKLRFGVQVNEASIVVYFAQREDGTTPPELYEYPGTVFEDYTERYVNHDAATRRAIVRAAAEIGKAMP